MAVSTIYTKQNDTKITFRHSPTIDDVPVLPEELAGCTLSFLLKSDDPAITPIKQTATILVDGSFSYEPTPSDVATIGKFKQEWEVVYPDNKKLTFPNNGYNVVKIIEDLG